MPTQTVNAITDDSGLFNVNNTSGDDTYGLDLLYHNTMPIRTPEGWGLRQRPTFDQWTDNSGAGTYGRGIIEWEGKGLYVISSTYYYDGGTTAISGGNGVEETIKASMFLAEQTSNTVNIIVNPGYQATEGNVYYATASNAAPTRITDVDMPGNSTQVLAAGGAYLDGYLFLGTQAGRIYNSDLNDITAWAGDFLTSERDSDLGVYCGRHHDTIVFLSSRSIEFFYDAANATGSPLARRNDVFYRVGTKLVNTIIESGDTIFFTGKNIAGEMGVYRIDTFNLRKISSPSFDFLLNKISQSNTDDPDVGPSAALVNTAESGLFYVLTLDETDIKGTYAMHVETGITSKWYAGGDPSFDVMYGTGWTTETRLPIVGSTMQASNNNTATPEADNLNKVIFSNGATAYVQDASNNGLDDLGLAAATPYYYIPPLDFGTSLRKKISGYRFLHYSLADDSIDPCNLTLSWVDIGSSLEVGGLDEDSFPAGRTVDISKPRYQILRPGSTYQRIHKVALTAGKRQLMRAVEIDFDIVGH